VGYIPRQRRIERVKHLAPTNGFGRGPRSCSTAMRQFLLIDADDTLWENNIYFERAFDEFAGFLDHSSMTPREVREVLDQIEEANNKIHGYGSANFARNLRQCYQHLAEREVREEDLRVAMGFAERILECPWR